MLRFFHYAYESFHDGTMQDYISADEDLQPGFESLPGVQLVFLAAYFVCMQFQPRPHIVNDRLIYKNKTYHSKELSYLPRFGKLLSIYANGKRLFTVSVDYINYYSLNAWIEKCDIALRIK